jgi:RimJ/RimL family protein N-acetyltransferase
MIAPVRTARLTLRQPQETDLAAMIAFGQSPRSAFIGGPLDDVECRDHYEGNADLWAERGHGFWSVDETATGRMVGRVGVISFVGWPEPELAWHLYDGFEGKGYGLEAAAAARAHFHAHVSPKPLMSMLSPDNPRSIALALRLGARPERDFELDGLPVVIYRHPGPELPA